MEGIVGKIKRLQAPRWLQISNLAEDGDEETERLSRQSLGQTSEEKKTKKRKNKRTGKEEKTTSDGRSRKS